MKKVLAIILCVVMLLPTFCATIYAEDPLTYEDVAAATREGGALAGEKDFPLDTLTPGGEAPIVDGVVNADEYALTKTYTDDDITARNNSKNYNAGKTTDNAGNAITNSYEKTNNGGNVYEKGVVTPEYVKVSINSDEKFFYFGIVAQFDNENEVKPSYNTFDLRFILSPKQGNVATMPTAWSGNTLNYSCYARFNPNGVLQTSNVHLGNTTYDKEHIYVEFAVDKSALISKFSLDANKPIDYIQYGFWIDSYQDDGMTSASRIGYGYDVTSALADYTGWAKQTRTNDWDDGYFTVKIADGEAIHTWDHVAACGVPFAAVSSVTKVPSVDGTISANEYSTKMTFTPEENAAGRADSKALAVNGKIPNMDVYISSSAENIYVAVEFVKLENKLIDGKYLRFAADFTDSVGLSPAYDNRLNHITSDGILYRYKITEKANTKNVTYSNTIDGVDTTLYTITQVGNDAWRNLGIGKEDSPTETLEGVNIATYNWNLNPVVEWDNNDSESKYTVEFVINKEIVKRAYSYEGDITAMHFGIWVNSINSTEGTRISYGASEASKQAVNKMAGYTVFTSDPNYDIDDCVATVAFTDAGVNKKVDALNLAKYGQLKFYANNPTTAENAIDGTMSSGEYAFDYTFRSMRSGGTASQWGVSLGNGTLAPAYAKIYMDYDSDYFYLGLRIKDTNFVPRYCGTGAAYNYTTKGDVKTPAEVKVDGKSVYDFYKVQIAFNNNGSIFEAAKELELQFYMNADINNDLNGDGIAQANELVPGFHVKSLVGGAEKALEGMSSAWSCDGSDEDDKTVKEASFGKWDTAKDELVFEVKLSKAEIAKAYGLESLNNTISFRMNHSPWQYTGGKSFDEIAGTTTAIATGGGGGNGLKVYTAYWDGVCNLHNTGTTLKSVIKGLAGTSEEPYMTSGDYGHVVVLGDEMAVNYVNTVDGASVRFTEGSTGMRFKTLVNKDYYDALIAKYGAENVAFGTVIAPVEYVAAAGTFTKAALDAKNPNPAGVDYLDIRTSQFYAENANTYTFLGSIANIKEVNYDRDFAAIGYVEYKDGNNTYTVYSASYTVRSVEEVAEMALNDFTTDATGACGYTVANTEIFAGKTVYTPYTDAQRTIAKKFVA